MDVLMRILKDTLLTCASITLVVFLVFGVLLTLPSSIYHDYFIPFAAAVFISSFIIRYYIEVENERVIQRFVDSGFSRKEAELILSCPKIFARSLLLITAERYYDLLMREEPTAVRDEEREKELIKRKLEELKLKEVIIGGV